METQRIVEVLSNIDLVVIIGIVCVTLATSVGALSESGYLKIMQTLVYLLLGSKGKDISIKAKSKIEKSKI
jgi:hypothetical protein